MTTLVNIFCRMCKHSSKGHSKGHIGRVIIIGYKLIGYKYSLIIR